MADMGLLDFDDTYVPLFVPKRVPVEDLVHNEMLNMLALSNHGHALRSEDFTDMESRMTTVKTPSDKTCNLEYVDGYLTCTINHHIGTPCLMDKSYEK